MNWDKAAELALPFLLGFCLMWLVGGSVARGQDHGHPSYDEAVHDRFYSNWLIPNGAAPRVSSCCNKQDCYPAAVKRQGGVWFFERREDGAWIRIPDHLIEQNQSDPRESPDDRSHVCAQPPGSNDRVYCFTFGSGM